MALTEDLIKTIVTVLIAVGGWIIGHYFTSERDRTNKKRELSLSYLIAAYRTLAHEISHRPNLTRDTKNKFELVVADIHLFGSREQILLVNQLVEGVVSGENFDLDPLLNNLRNSLREQIELEKINGNVKWVRFK